MPAWLRPARRAQLGAWLGAWLAFAALAAPCGCKKPAPSAPDAGVSASPPAQTTPPPPPVLASAAKGTSAPLSPSAVPSGLAKDGGVAACRLLSGPEPQAFRGAVTFAVDGARVALVANEAGRPRVEWMSAGKRGAPPPPANAPIEVLSRLPCAVAGKVTYCPSPTGVVRRFAPGAEREVGTARPGTRIAAAALGADEAHAVVAFLVEKTGGGETVMHAFAALDDGPPQRLSEDGSGATQVALVSLGDKVLALYLDARMAMTPIHAREISLNAAGGLVLGPDAVLSVGGPAERGVSLGAARAGADAFALVPLPTDVTNFGMVALKVPSPPRPDVKPVVSPYANGLDPAPFAATRAGARMRVARVVPESAAPGAARALELGRLTSDGEFRSHGFVARGAVTDVAIVEDAGSTLWLGFGDATRAWLARFACP